MPTAWLGNNNTIAHVELYIMTMNKEDKSKYKLHHVNYISKLSYEFLKKHKEYFKRKNMVTLELAKDCNIEALAAEVIQVCHGTEIETEPFNVEDFTQIMDKIFELGKIAISRGWIEA